MLKFMLKDTVACAGEQRQLLKTGSKDRVSNDRLFRNGRSSSPRHWRNGPRAAVGAGP
ncbi:MAG: hypothetical protein Kow001_21750 [Acidobacteriota bacterium]